jgi:hypothetical protein
MNETNYNMPRTKSEYEIFNEDPVGWMQKHIEANLPSDNISGAVFQVASAYGIKHTSKDFFVILAFLALMTNERLESDFKTYRANNANPEFYSNLINIQNRQI